MESNQCVCYNAWRTIESILKSMLQMNMSNSSGLQVSSTDSGFIQNSLPSSANRIMLAMVSYLLNRMPRLNRTREVHPASSIQKEVKGKKMGKAIKDFLPSHVKNPCREGKPLPVADNFNREYEPFIEANDIPEEWPDDETVKNFDFGLDSPYLFEDSIKRIALPYSIQAETNGDVKWLRPKEYVREYYIEKEIKHRMPTRNHIKIRKKIGELYHIKNYSNTSFLKSESAASSGGNVENNLKIMGKAQPRRSFTMNFLRENEKSTDEYQNELLKEYQKIYEKEYDYKICKYFERDETEEEFIKRKACTENKIAKEISAKQEKDKKKKQTEKLLPNLTKGKVKDFLPSDLNMTEKYPKFSKWLTSIFQFIKDMNVADAFTGENIWNKIYPQKDGVPIYNPSGQYWVKLYFMGKHRKIVIDDRMPCGMYEEFLLPKCEILEELWPSIISKALIKLFSFKYKCSDYIYEEVGDPSIIYALTGYIGERHMLNLGSFEDATDSTYNLNFFENISDSPSFHILNNILSGQTFEKKQKFLLGFNSSVPFEDQKFGFINILRENKLLTSLNTVRNSQLRKKTSFFDLNMVEEKSKKVPQKLLRTLTKKSSVTMDKLLSEPKHDLKKIKETDFSDKNNSYKKSAITKNFTLGESSAKAIIKDEKNLALLSSLNKNNIGPKSTLQLINLDDSPENKISKETPIQQYSRNQSILGSYGGLGFDMISSKRRLSSSNVVVVPTNQRPEHEIYSDFAYSIVEIFCSDNFNMRRLKPVDFSDLKRKILDARVSYKQLSKEDKKHYIQNLKELKTKQNEEKTKRLDELKKPGDKFFLMKIKNDCIDRKSAPLNFYLNFDDKEIEMAKLCMANTWDFPPPNFFIDTYISSHDVSSENGPEDPKVKNDIQSLNWTEEFYKEQILQNELSKYENFKSIKSRMKGLWMTMKFFSEMFKYFVVLHNPTFYPYQIEIQNLYTNYKQDLYSPDPEYSVFHLSPGKTETYNNKENYKNSCILFLFEPNTSRQMDYHSDKFRDINYYLTMDILNSNGQSILNNRVICFSQFFSAFQYDSLDFEEHYYLIIKGSITPFGYHMKILSDHMIENLSYQNFLKTVQHYTSHSLNIQIPPIGENQFYLLARMKTSMKIDSDSKMIITSSKFKDIYFKQFIEVYVFFLEDEEALTYSHRRLFLDKEFYLSSIVNVYKYEEFKMFFIFCCQAPFSVNESSLEIEILTNFDFNRPDQIEHVEPFEITDFYIPNKHGLVCKELIYVPTDIEVLASIQFELLLNDQSMNEKIRMQVLITKGEEILYVREFLNSMIAHNIVFDNTKRLVEEEPKKSENVPAIKKNSSNKVSNVTSTENFPFQLTWLIDLSECPSIIYSSSEENRISWSIRIFSSDSLAFVKDTIKEDTERTMKESWEVNEPGRSELAHLARVKFLMQLRKEKGEKLAEEEEAILKKTRKRKNKILITNVQKDADKKGKPLKKEEKINVNNNKATVSSTMSLPETNSEDANKPTKQLPISSQHQSTYLKNFLDYTYDKRVIEKGIKYPMGNPAPFCRSEEQVRALKENIEYKTENFQINIINEIHSGMKEKNELAESLTKDYQKVLAKRNKRHGKYLKELQIRNDLRDSLLKSKIFDK